MANIIGIAGKKGAGKTTLRNYVYCNILNTQGFDCWLNNDGQIITFVGEEGDENTVGVIDFDGLFGYSDIAETMIYPNFQSFALADSLKALIATFYKIDTDKLYGTNADKDSPTKYTVGDLYGKCPPNRGLKELVNHREFMEQMAKKIRKVDDNAFHNAIEKLIDGCKAKLIMINDLRDQSDIDWVKSRGGKVVKLANDPYNSSSDGDAPLDKIPIEYFDLVLSGDRKTVHDLFWDAIVAWNYFN